MTKDASVTGVYGRRGSGKTTWLERELKPCRRLIAVTPIVDDFTGRTYQHVATMGELVTVLRHRWNGRAGFRIVYRPEIEDDAMVERLHTLSKIVRKVQQPYAERRDSRQITLAVDELNLAYPHSPPRGLDAFTWSVLQGRHWGVNVYGATQRPTDVNPKFRGNCDRVICFPLADDRSIKAVTDVAGSRHKEALQALENHRYLELVNGAATAGRNPPMRKKSRPKIP